MNRRAGLTLVLVTAGVVFHLWHFAPEQNGGAYWRFGSWIERPVNAFGLPIYRWSSQEDVYADINAWWRGNRDAGKVSVRSATRIAAVGTNPGDIEMHLKGLTQLEQ